MRKKAGHPILLKATNIKQCDNCESQEGRHYCLLYGVQVKNMDVARCRFWSINKEVK
jgi:hypothetical protein